MSNDGIIRKTNPNSRVKTDQEQEDDREARIVMSLSDGIARDMKFWAEDIAGEFLFTDKQVDAIACAIATHTWVWDDAIKKQLTEDFTAALAQAVGKMEGALNKLRDEIEMREAAEQRGVLKALTLMGADRQLIGKALDVPKVIEPKAVERKVPDALVERLHDVERLAHRIERQVKAVMENDRKRHLVNEAQGRTLSKRIAALETEVKRVAAEVDDE